MFNLTSPSSIQEHRIAGKQRGWHCGVNLSPVQWMSALSALPRSIADVGPLLPASRSIAKRYESDSIGTKLMNATRLRLASGYSIDRDVLSGVECDQVLHALALSSFRRGRAGARHLMSQPDVCRIASDSRMIQLACNALGSDAVPYRATLFEKSGAANWLVVWHQDTALPLQSRFDLAGWGPWSTKAGVLYAHAPSWALSHIVALRLHLDASTIDNGPLRILPSTHSQGVLSDADISCLARSRTPVDCVVPRGGVMTMYPLLIHASGKARSDAPRRVLHIEYSDSLVLASGIQLAVV